MLYQKLKSFSLKLDDKIKEELSKGKYESVSPPDVFKEKIKVDNKPSFIKILLSKVRLKKVKIIYFSVLSFFVDIAITATEQFLIIFGDPADSFNLLFRQQGLNACPVSYATFKKKQKHAKVFSLTGIITIVLVTAMSSLIINLMTGPIERTMAATYNFVQSSWASGVTDTSSECSAAGTPGGTWTGTECTATHDNNQANYTGYAATTTGIVAGADLTLSAVSGDWTEDASNATFNTYASASSSLSVAAASITILKPNGAKCGADAECESGDCSCAGLCQTPSSPKTVVWVTANHHRGNTLGGRTGVNNICNSDGNKPACITNVYGFLSVSANDEIRDLQSDDVDSDGYTGPFDSAEPIYWIKPDGTLTLLANDWADILNGSISNTQATGTGSSQYVWTNSYSSGNLHVYACGSGSGERGHYTKKTGNWLADGYQSCGSDNEIRCIGILQP